MTAATMATNNVADEIQALNNADVQVGNLSDARDANNIGNSHHVYNNNKAGELRASDNARVQIGNNVVNNYNENKNPVDVCFKDLMEIDPQLEKEDRGRPIEGVYELILGRKAFKKWCADKQSTLLWIKGGPGKGKTMLLCSIIDYLHPLSKLAKGQSNLLLTYFFCQGRDARRNNPLAVIRGLIYLLCRQQPSLLHRHVLEKHKQAGEQLFSNKDAWLSCRVIFKDILSDPELPSTYVVVDALDECEGDLSELLRFIVECTEISPRVKWIVASRNLSSIEGHINLVRSKRLLDLETNTTSVNAAVEHYVREMVQTLASENQYSDATKSVVEDYLLQKADGTFLWVALVCQELRQLGQTSASRTLGTLRTFPPGLSAAYKRIFDRILALQPRQKDVCMKLLAVVAAAYRPLSLDELDALVENHEGDHLGRIVERCGTFLVTRDGRTVDFVHQSAKEFLRNDVCTLFPNGEEEVHQRLFQRSLASMSNTLRHDMYGIEHPGIPIGGVKTPTQDPLSGARYSCVYWVDHLCNAITKQNPVLMGELKDSGVLDRFLREKFLYWLEALSLLKNIPAGMKATAELEMLLHGWTGCSQLLALVQDARRFIMAFGSVIGDAPLQAYTSALVFSPEESIIKQLFAKEMPLWIQSWPTMAKKWDACLMTFDGHNEQISQASIAFPPSGPRVLTASETHGTIDIRDVSIQDTKARETHLDTASKVLETAFSPGGQGVAMRIFCEVRIWNVADTPPRRTVCFYHSKKTDISSFIFLNSGENIALGLDNGNLQVWDHASRRRLAILRGNNDSRISSMAISPDDQFIASRSRYCDETLRSNGCVRSEMPMDCSIGIWNVAKRCWESKITDHDKLAGPIAFSPEGGYVASGVDGNTFKIWKAKTSSRETWIGRHDEEVTSITFSPDGKRVASGSKDRDIKIWDLTTGDCEATLCGHVSGLMSIAFSPDGQYIASVSRDSAIKIWDATTRYDRVAHDVHTDDIQSIALSLAGQCIVSVDQSDLKIWDATTGRGRRTIAARERESPPIVLSPDGRHIASGLDDFSVTIWDAMNGSYWYALKGHVDRVTSIAFSSDGKYLTSGSRGGTVKIWDYLGRRCRATFDGHAGEVWSIAFSSDGQFVATGSRRSIKIWDIIGRCCQATIKGVFLKPIAFSTNRHIASASRKSVKIWDALTGRLVVMIPMAHDIQSLSFDSRGENILTDAGKFKVSEGVPPPSRPHTMWNQLFGTKPGHAPHQAHGYGISANKDWITYNGQNILWIPAEYRPQVVAISGLSFAMGCRSKRVVIFRFDPKPYKHFLRRLLTPLLDKEAQQAIRASLEQNLSLLSVFFAFIFTFCRPFLWVRPVARDRK